MREKLFTWSGKPLLVVLLLFAGLCFSNRLQAQTLTFGATTQSRGNWYDESTAITRLTQAIKTLEGAIQSPPGSPSLAFLKYQRWYYVEILTAIQGGETVSSAVGIGGQKVGGTIKPDTPNPDLTPKEISDLFKSAVTLLTY